ncbi:MAG: HAD-IA family hydrolase [Anaerolineales bacterium]|nr:HAD-IA family hydrolase [Anaerolineales bacterium]
MTLKQYSTPSLRIKGAVQPLRQACTTILFDLDGTLLDSEQINAMVVQRMYREVLERDPDPDELEQSRTLSTEDILAELAPKDMDFLMHIWPQYYKEYGHLLSLYPEIPQLLSTLKEQGFKTGVVTLQNRAEVAATRDLVDLDPWIDTWVAVDDSTHPKPHSAPIWKALSNLDASPDQTIMIGDSATDIIAGQRAGVLTGAALWGCFQPELLLQQNPDYVFKEPPEVERLCQKKA